MSTENEVVAWGMVRPDGLVLDCICPDEHAAYGGSYTVPMFPQSSIDRRDARIRELEAEVVRWKGIAVKHADYEEKADERIAALEAQLRDQAPARQPHGWLPIDSAPKDGSLFVASGHNHGDSALGWHYVIASWKNDAFKESTEWNDESTLTYLTHWMPLPAPLEHDITGERNEI